MFHVVLVAPEIPPNTGNVIRLCANTGCRLHLVEPLGFTLSDAQLRRAGLDYHEMTCVTVHPDWRTCRAALGETRLFALTTRAVRRHASADPGNTAAHDFRPGDAFVFGSESCGLPNVVLDDIDADHRLRLPLLPGNRSLNLSNAVAVMVYEAWRQQHFAGGV
ncbi:MAG: tRNA (cytidine(34)-2'-O)-methyltransferase [Sulfuritalea sp.]|nr:tRNA (cytidine(34)-2'-O)-methyltransferase [Sulfuritalea sp.]